MTRLILTTPSAILASAIAAVATNVGGYDQEGFTLEHAESALAQLFDGDPDSEDHAHAYQTLKSIYDRAAGASNILAKIPQPSIEVDLETNEVLVNGLCELRFARDLYEALLKTMGNIVGDAGKAIEKLEKQNAVLKGMVDQASGGGAIAPNLGLATNEELQAELKARYEFGNTHPQYTTVGGTPSQIVGDVDTTTLDGGDAGAAVIAEANKSSPDNVVEILRRTSGAR